MRLLLVIYLLNFLGLMVDGQQAPASTAVPGISCSNGIAQLIDECPQIDQLNQLAADLLSRSIVEEKEFPSGCCRVISDLNAGRCFCDEDIVTQFRDVIDDEFLPSLLFQASQVEPAGCSIRILAAVDKEECEPFGNQFFPQDIEEVEQECTGSNLISQVLSQSDDNQFLVEAIDLLDLQSQLDVLPVVTLLAPTDKAFNDWAEAEGIAPTELFADEDFLVRILARHIVANATIEPENIQDPERFKALQGSFLNFIVNDDTLFVQGYPVQQPALQACNGLIYKIDTVLWPDNKTASSEDIQAATGQVLPSTPEIVPETPPPIPQSASTPTPELTLSATPTSTLTPTPPSPPTPAPQPKTFLPPLTLPTFKETVPSNASTSIEISPLVMSLPQVPPVDSMEPQLVQSPDAEVKPASPPTIEPSTELIAQQQNTDYEAFKDSTGMLLATSSVPPKMLTAPASEPPQAEQKVGQRATTVMEKEPSVEQEPIPYDPTATGPAVMTRSAEEKPCTINVFQLTTQFLPLFSNFLEYAEQQGLKDILEKSNGITVIIPINTAFSGISDEELAATWNPLNHIVMEELSLQDLTELTEPLETLGGLVDVTTSSSGKVGFGDVTTGGTEVVQSDVVGCNGRLQVVGQLILNSEVTPIAAGADFSTPETPVDQQFVDQIQSITTIETSPTPSPTEPIASLPVATIPPPSSPPPHISLSSPPPLIPSPPPPLASPSTVDPTAPTTVLPEIVSSMTSTTQVASATAVGTIPGSTLTPTIGIGIEQTITPTPTPTLEPVLPSPTPTPSFDALGAIPELPQSVVNANPLQPSQQVPYVLPTPNNIIQNFPAPVVAPSLEIVATPSTEERLISTRNPAEYEYSSPQLINSPNNFVPPDDFSNRQTFNGAADGLQQRVGSVTPTPTPTPTTTYTTFSQPTYTPAPNPAPVPTAIVTGSVYEQYQQVSPQVISKPKELQNRVSPGSGMSAITSEVEIIGVVEGGVPPSPSPPVIGVVEGGVPPSPSPPVFTTYSQSQPIVDDDFGVTTPNQEEGDSVPPCACTQDGMSGGVNTSLIGCGVFVEGWPSFCYVVNPYGCFLSQPSQKYAGARWRNCTIVEDDVGSSTVSQLDVLQQVAEGINQAPPQPQGGGYLAPIETQAPPTPAGSASTGPCSCSPTGTSGGVQTGRPGCVEHVPGYSPFCYVLDPLNCFVSRSSTRYPSAGWRYCAVPSSGDEQAPSEMQNVVRVTILPVYDPLTGQSRYGMFLTPKDKSKKL